MTKKKNGSIDIQLALILSLVLMLLIYTSITEFMQPIVKYINFNQVCRKYALKMEKDGGLSLSERQALQNDLLNIGVSATDYTIVQATPTTVAYGEDVTLEITYNCNYKTKTINGLSIKGATSVIPMRFYKSTTSKKG